MESANASMKVAIENHAPSKKRRFALDSPDKCPSSYHIKAVDPPHHLESGRRNYTVE
jgi:hypothetical protein